MIAAVEKNLLFQVCFFLKAISADRSVVNITNLTVSVDIKHIVGRYIRLVGIRNVVGNDIQRRRIGLNKILRIVAERCKNMRFPVIVCGNEIFAFVNDNYVCVIYNVPVNVANVRQHGLRRGGRRGRIFALAGKLVI